MRKTFFLPLFVLRACSSVFQIWFQSLPESTAIGVDSSANKALDLATFFCPSLGYIVGSKVDQSYTEAVKCYIKSAGLGYLSTNF
jgi:hypothetical protein